MAKKDITKKVIGIGTGLALGVFPLVSNAQDYVKIQKGINAPTYLGENEAKTHIAYHFKFNKDLQKQVNGYKNSQVYITGDQLDSYLVVDPNNTGYTLYYAKKNLNEDGEGKKIGVAVTGREHIDPCAPNVPGSKTNALASVFWGPIDLLGQLESAKPDKEPTKEPASNYSQTIINKDSHDTYINNYFYGDTAKAKEAQQKLSSLELRTLIEGSKTMNPIESPFFGGTAALQLGKGAVWFGPYITAGFGSEKSSSSTPVYHETLLNQAIQLSTITEGVRNESAELSYPIEFGGLLSVGSKDGRVRFNAGLGVVNEESVTSDVVETGHDWMSQNGVVVGEKKPYAINLKEGLKSNKYIPTQKVGVDVHPFKNSGFYLGGEAQHKGKVNSKVDKIHYHVKAGWRFGGRKK